MRSSDFNLDRERLYGFKKGTNQYIRMRRIDWILGGYLTWWTYPESTENLFVRHLYEDEDTQPIRIMYTLAYKGNIYVPYATLLREGEKFLESRMKFLLSDLLFTHPRFNKDPYPLFQSIAEGTCDIIVRSIKEGTSLEFYRTSGRDRFELWDTVRAYQAGRDSRIVWNYDEDIKIGKAEGERLRQMLFNVIYKQTLDAPI